MLAAGCGAPQASDDTAAALMGLPVPSQIIPAGYYGFNTVEDDQQVGAESVAAGSRLMLDPSVGSQLAKKGTITWKPKKGDPQECVLTIDMSAVLHNAVRTHASLAATLLYSNTGYSPHADDPALSYPIGLSPYCLNHAMDVTQWNSQRVSILAPEAALTAALNALDTLPPGHYDIGFLRNPYPTGYGATQNKDQWDHYHGGVLASLCSATSPPGST
jgi:hypothetical protein